MHVVDGFALGGSALLNIGKSYGPITRYSAQLWNAIWQVSAMNSYVIDKGVENLIKDDFMVLLDEVKPDVILSIHPNFNGSVINILRKERIQIPFGTLIADLVIKDTPDVPQLRDVLYSLLEAIDIFIRAKTAEGLRPGTIKGYHEIFSYFRQWLDNDTTKVNEITADTITIRQFINYP
ncbi:hypothetical protein [Neobacillus massiliamazoniensis]|uniref:hypothetical protein n=1 Tax=Neobacillus massiliamazoniensis TaxID=1499688 RepID=UPI001FDF4C9B